MTADTDLEYQDGMLALPRGAWVIALEPMTATLIPTSERRQVSYEAGARFRVSSTYAETDTFIAYDTTGRKVAFERLELTKLQPE